MSVRGDPNDDINTVSKSETSLNSRIAVGAIWSILMRLGIRAIGVVSVIILARILAPADFGIVAKASMVASFLELVTQFGLDAALIHNQKAKRAHYDTVWTIHFVRGLVIAVLLVLLAYPASQFFNESALKLILLFYATCAFLNGLENVGIVDFRKNLKFDRDFRFNVYKKLGGFVAAIAVAMIWQTYWAFVAGVVATSVVGLLASYGMSGYRPRFAISEWKSLFHFSKWIFLGGLVASISTKLDTFILSRFSTNTVLGQYSVAHEIAEASTAEVAMPIARATMPGLAMLQDESGGFKETYTLSSLMVMMIVIPAAVGVSALSEPLTLVLLGEKWAEAASLLEILAIYGIMRASFSLSASAFLASGEVRMHTNLSISNLALRAVAMGFGYATGAVIGLAWGVLWASVAQFVISLYVQSSLNFFDVRKLASGLWRTVLAAAIMYVSLTEGRDLFRWIHDPNTIVGLMAQVLSGFLVFTITLGVLWVLAGRTAGPEQVVFNFLQKKFLKRST